MVPVPDDQRTLFAWERMTRAVETASVDLFVATQYWSPPVLRRTLRVVHDVYPLLSHAVLPRREELVERFGVSNLKRMLSERGAIDHAVAVLSTPGLAKAFFQAAFASGVSTADRICVPSRHTRSELSRYYPQVEERTEIIPHALPNSKVHPPHQRRRVVESLSLTALHVGNWEPRRGHPELLRWARNLWRDGRLERLVLVGAPAGNHSSHFARLRNAVDRGVSEQWLTLSPRLTDEQLRDEYYQSNLLVVSSSHEGFCYPALEAMSVGTPVVCRTDTAVAELCGPAAITYSRRLDEVEWYRGVDLMGEELHTASEAGIARALEYSLRRMGEAYCLLIEEALN